MSSLTCPNCSASFESAVAPGSAVACAYCGATVIVPKSAPQTGGISLNTSGNIPVSSDMVSGDLVKPQPADPFDSVEQLIDARPNDLNTDKARLKEAVRKIRMHAQRERGRDLEEVEHELEYLLENAPPVFDATVARLTDPSLQALARNVKRLAEAPTPPPPTFTPPVFKPESIDPVEIARKVSWLTSLPQRMQRASGAIITAFVIGCCVLPALATVACSALLVVIGGSNTR